MFNLFSCLGMSQSPSVHVITLAEIHPDCLQKSAVKLYQLDPLQDRSIVMSADLSYDAMTKVGEAFSKVCSEVMAIRSLGDICIFFGRPSDTYQRRKLLRDLGKIQGVRQVAIQTKDFDMEYPLPYQCQTQMNPEGLLNLNYTHVSASLEELILSNKAP